MHTLKEIEKTIKSEWANLTLLTLKQKDFANTVHIQNAAVYLTSALAELLQVSEEPYGNNLN